MPQNYITSGPGAAALLPDTERRTGPYKAFASDPGWNEAWWWLGIPALLAISLIGIQAVSREFYATWVLPEGYGFLELGQFFVAVTGFAVALKLAVRPYVRSRSLLFAFLFLAALGCFYIAGEEHSWGQHFFHWQTPEYWAELNRQQETNLHNTMHLFGKKPRALLEFGILVGGLILPLLAVFYPAIRTNRWSLFIPPDAIVPLALGAVLFKATGALQKTFQRLCHIKQPQRENENFLNA